jgi:quinolinate synthase
MISFDLCDEIRALKKERKAVLLAHYYVDGAIQDLADFVGDSLQLARYAKKVKAEMIFFAGVHFMGEVAKILNPEIPVILPTLEAGCSLADGCPLDRFLAYKQEIQDATGRDPISIAYINCSIDIKAEVDIICTSSNAAKVIQTMSLRYPNRPLFFVPDQYLGTNLGHQLKKELFPYTQGWPKNPQANSSQMYLFNGSCQVHEQFSAKRLLLLKQKHPLALVLAHSECRPEVVALADVVGSTTALLETVRDHPASTFIILTEAGILHKMKQDAPHKVLIPGPTEEESCHCNECPFMKKNTLENLWESMKSLEPAIELKEEKRLRALQALEAMLAIS